MHDFFEGFLIKIMPKVHDFVNKLNHLVQSRSIQGVKERFDDICSCFVIWVLFAEHPLKHANDFGKITSLFVL